jgi:hypothetical protein
MRKLLALALLAAPLLAEGTISYRKSVKLDPAYRSRFTAEELDRILGAAPRSVEADAEKVALAQPRRSPRAELISYVEPVAGPVEYVEEERYDGCDEPVLSTVAVSYSYAGCGTSAWYGGGACYRPYYGACYRPYYRSSWCGPRYAGCGSRWSVGIGASYGFGCGSGIGIGIGYGYGGGCRVGYRGRCR